MGRQRNSEFFFYLPFGVRLRRHATVQTLQRVLFLGLTTGFLVVGLVWLVNL